MDIEELKDFLAKYIKRDSHRYLHSLAVAKQAKLYAHAHGVDEEKAEKVGLMHDIAKEMTEEESLKYIKENNVKVAEDELKESDLLHGPIAADICKKELGFDEEMCDAIEHHSTAKANMSNLAKVLYCADKTDETRTYWDVEDYRKLALSDLDECTYAILVWWMDEYKKANREPLTNTKNAYEYYKKQLNKN